MTTLNPVFVQLMDRYYELESAGLSQSEEACLLFDEAMNYAPESFLHEVHDIAVELGLLPATPDGYSDDGEPLYNLEALAERLGFDVGDVPDFILQKSYQGRVHLVN